MENFYVEPLLHEFLLILKKRRSKNSIRKKGNNENLDHFGRNLIEMARVMNSFAHLQFISICRRSSRNVSNLFGDSRSEKSFQFSVTDLWHRGIPLCRLELSEIRRQLACMKSALMLMKWEFIMWGGHSTHETTKAFISVALHVSCYPFCSCGTINEYFLCLVFSLSWSRINSARNSAEWEKRSRKPHNKKARQ